MQPIAQRRIVRWRIGSKTCVIGVLLLVAAHRVAGVRIEGAHRATIVLGDAAMDCEVAAWTATVVVLHAKASVRARACAVSGRNHVGVDLDVIGTGWLDHDVKVGNESKRIVGRCVRFWVVNVCKRSGNVDIAVRRERQSSVELALQVKISRTAGGSSCRRAVDKYKAILRYVCNGIASSRARI